MKEIQVLLSKKQAKFLLGGALAVGVLAMILFIGRPLGISWLVFTTALLALLVVMGKKVGIGMERRNLWLWPLLLFFAAMVFVRANPLLTFLNSVATLGLLTLIFYFYARDSVDQLPLAGLLSLPLRLLGQASLYGLPLVTHAVQSEHGGHGRRQELLPVLRGGALALPVLVVFAFLLASADLVFSSYLRRLVGVDFTTISPYLGRGIFTGVITLFAAGATAVALKRGLTADEHQESWVERMAQDMPRHISLGAVETATIILSVSGLFLAFMLLQFTYLFGGEANIGREGLTYAEYARRGFFELVLVASLSLALILLLNWLTRRESKRQIKWFNALSSVLISLVLLLLVTAFWRMRLYEQAFGYTELRLIVLVFECWLGVLLLWFLWTLWRAPERFAVGVLLVAVGFVATLNWLNPDALIVRHNMDHYHETGELDMLYLTHLSADALPELAAAYPAIAADEQLIYAPWCDDEDCAQTLAKILTDNLQARYDQMNDDSRWKSILSYHRARADAYQVLARFHGAW